MQKFIRHFARQADGAWICARSCELQSPVGRIQASKGAYIVAKSDMGLYALLHVTDVTASASGTVNLTGWAKW